MILSHVKSEVIDDYTGATVFNCVEQVVQMKTWMHYLGPVNKYSGMHINWLLNFLLVHLLSLLIWPDVWELLSNSLSPHQFCTV